jgi:outer membrane receptor for ferrienterochelin and colicins
MQVTNKKSLAAFAMLLLLTYTASFATEPPKKTDANVFGDVQSLGEHIPFVSIFLEGTTIGTTTDVSGHYILTNLPVGKHTFW